jgi:hypothetical protein
MPWCPRCDEVFPEGPACPRCSARLIDGGRGSAHEELQAVQQLPQIRVSRRDRRALERLSGPRAPSSRALVCAVAALVFAVGFLLGRLGSLEMSQPSVRALPGVHGLALDDVEGSASYLLWTDDQLATIAAHDLFSGDVVPRLRMTPPFDPADITRTEVAALGSSVATLVSDERRSYVAFVARGGSPHGWVPGVEAAWVSPDELWVRQAGGTLVAWSTGTDGIEAKRSGVAEHIFQVPDGAVVQRGDRLVRLGDRASGDEMSIPEAGDVMATDGRRALVGGKQLVLSDGRSLTPVRIQEPRVLSASFERSGERVAMALREGDQLSVAIVDARGNAALKPLGARAGDCAPGMSWDRSGRWVYVAPGDGMLYAVEASGGRVQPVRVRNVGCGVAWLPG